MHKLGQTLTLEMEEELFPAASHVHVTKLKLTSQQYIPEQAVFAEIAWLTAMRTAAIIPSRKKADMGVLVRESLCRQNGRLA